MKLKSAFFLVLAFAGAQTVTASTITHLDAASIAASSVALTFEVPDAGSFSDDTFSDDTFSGDTGGLSLPVTRTSSAAPEPASFVLIGFGLVGVGLYHRKKCPSQPQKPLPPSTSST